MRKFFKKAIAEPTAAEKAAFEKMGVTTRAEAEQWIFDKHGIDIAAIRRRTLPSRVLRLSTVWGGVAAGVLLGGAHVRAAVALTVFVNAVALVLIGEWGSEQPRLTKRMLLAQTGSLGVLFGALGAAVFRFLSTHA